MIKKVKVMYQLIIALLFRVNMSELTMLEKIEYYLYVVGFMLADTDFSDAESIALINTLKQAADDAGLAAKAAESKATIAIKLSNQKEKEMDAAYKSLVLRAEEVCGGDVDKALKTAIKQRKKRIGKKEALRPENLRSKEGKQEGEIAARCKGQGKGIQFKWEYRKKGDAAWIYAETTSTITYLFTKLDSGLKYEVRVTAKSSKGYSEPSDLSECRAK